MIKLLKYLREYKLNAILAPITIILEVVIEVFIPYIMSWMIDNGIQNKDIAYVIKMGLLMLAMAFASLAMGALSGKFAAAASTGFAKNLRQALFYKTQDFSFANVDKFSTASLVTRMTTDVTNTQNALMLMLRIMFRAPVMLISATVMAVCIQPRLSMIFLIAIPVLGLAIAFLITRAKSLFEKMLKKYDSMNGSVQENLIGIRVVKAFVREDHEKQSFRDAAEKLQKAQLKAEKTIVFAMPIMMFTVYACIIAVCWFSGQIIADGADFTTGQFTSFMSYIVQILMSLMMISMVFVSLVLAKASINRINEVLAEEIDITDDDADAEIVVGDGSIDFEHVNFRYGGGDGNLTLADISFHINPGEMVGVIGGTGAAKTTLVQLIPRLYDVNSGSIKVGGRDVREYKLKTLRDAVSMVLQKNVLFSGTIKDNLKWGDEEATDEQVIEAAKAAQAHDFVMSFPDGYDTDLGQGGVNVSGGQKQRLCIARALLKKPKVIILDDSTSAVDTATDAKIRSALRASLKDMTAIIIAQRITSVMDADRIIILDDGKIADMGTHDELLVRSEIYREVYESQQKGVEA